VFSLTLRVKYFKSSMGVKGGQRSTWSTRRWPMSYFESEHWHYFTTLPPSYMSCVTVSTARGLRIDDLCHITSCTPTLFPPPSLPLICPVWLFYSDQSRPCNERQRNGIGDSRPSHSLRTSWSCATESSVWDVAYTCGELCHLVRSASVAATGRLAAVRCNRVFVW